MTNDNTPPPAWVCLDCAAGADSLCRKADGSHTFETLARVYLSRAEPTGEMGDTHHQAFDCIADMARTAPLAACGFLVVACAQCTNIAELCFLAAGPLEDLLEAHGPAVITELERIAKVDPRFRLMLSGTWGRSRIDGAVWKRLEAAVAPGPVLDRDPRTPGAASSAATLTPEESALLFSPGRPAITRH